MSYADTGTPTDDQFAENLARTVKTLMAARGLKVADMWERTHTARNTWYTRMADGHWTAWQMLQLAEVLDVPVEDLYRDPADLIRSRCFAPLTLVSGGADDSDDSGISPDVIRPTLSVVRS